MKIDVQKLHSGPLEIELDHRPAYFELQGDDYKVISNVTGKLTLTLMNERVVMEGIVRALVRVHCVRCLKEVDIPVEKKAMVVYVEDRPGDQKRFKPEDNREEASHYCGRTIVLDRDIRGLILVNLPDYPLCSESCKGICVKCGQDLNMKNCHCLDEWKPMEVKEKSWKEALKDIIKDNKSS